MTNRFRIYMTSLLLLLVAGFVVLVYLFHDYTENYAIQEAEKQVQDALLTHRAIHKYVTKVSRPELYRLKDEGILYEEYFNPKTMSFTYQARGIKDFLNQEREAVGKPKIYFKLASNNPRNVINQADEREGLLLKQMNEGELEEFREIIQDENGKKELYIAMATKPIVYGCLKCHGDPKDAPLEMVALYPKAKGYYEKVGDIRALISIRIPLEQHLTDGKQIANALTFITFVILSVIYALIWYFLHHSSKQHQIILSKNQELEKISTTDYLTNVHNRLGFMQLAEQEFSVAKRYEKTFSLIMIDLDHFKQINDSFGHKVGDLVLRELCNIVKQQLRASDIFGRVGGEEFLIASIEQDQDGAVGLAEKLRITVENAKFTENLELTASFGVVQLHEEGSLSELITNADEALYQSKHTGRNKVTLFGA